MKYSIPVWDMIRSCVASQPNNAVILTRNIRECVLRRYNRETVNLNTLNSQIIGCSVNHPSSHHYSTPVSKKFLYYLGYGKYRKYQRATDGTWTKTPDGMRRVASTEIETKGTHFVQINADGTVQIPNAVRNKLNIMKKGDFVAFSITEKKVVVSKGELRVVV